MISEGQRLQYLEAMGIQPWVRRERAMGPGIREPDHLDPAEPENPVTVSHSSGEQHGNQVSATPACFEIGPGSGSTLLLCNHPEDAATPLASDIARCLDEAPVWGWRTHRTGGAGTAKPGLSLERAINERLFTRVLVFCDDSAALPVGQFEVLSSACIIYAPPLAELAGHPAHKRRLWMQLLTHGWCARSH